MRDAKSSNFCQIAKARKLRVKDWLRQQHAVPISIWFGIYVCSYLFSSVLFIPPHDIRLFHVLCVTLLCYLHIVVSVCGSFA